MKKVFFHACCGPCLSGIVDGLNEFKSEEIEVTAFYFNPFIHPYLEYELRKTSFERYCSQKNIDYCVEDAYDINGIYIAENSSDNRCKVCYSARLDKTAKIAKEKGFSAYSTTLLISPYQDHELLIELGEKFAQKNEIDFYYHDFREFFHRSKVSAKTYNLYKQQYCGCIFSEYERYSDEKQKKGKIKNVERILY